MKVAITMDLDTTVRTRFKQGVGQGVELVFADSGSREAVVALCKGARVVVGPSHLDEVLSACPSVELVQVPWAGVDDLCVIVRRHDGVRLVNSHANAYVTAQYAVAMALALLNRLIPGHEIMKGGRWDRRWARPSPANLSDKTVGVLGAGSIGTETARLLRAFVSRIIGLKRNPASAQTTVFDRVVGPEQLDGLISETDLLIITLPLTGETRDLIGLDQLRLLGPVGYLVNVGRGEVVNEHDLYEALRRNVIAGAALDVWYDYSPAADEKGRRYPFNEPFHELDNVLMSPHRAGWTEPAPDYWDDIIENINRMAAGENELLNEVDVAEGY